LINVRDEHGKGKRVRRWKEGKVDIEDNSTRELYVTTEKYRMVWGMRKKILTTRNQIEKKRKEIAKQNKIWWKEKK
jgi:hypothetical protein